MTSQKIFIHIHLINIYYSLTFSLATNMDANTGKLQYLFNCKSKQNQPYFKLGCNSLATLLIRCEYYAIQQAVKVWKTEGPISLQLSCIARSNFCALYVWAYTRFTHPSNTKALNQNTSHIPERNGIGLQQPATNANSRVRSTIYCTFWFPLLLSLLFSVCLWKFLCLFLFVCLPACLSGSIDVEGHFDKDVQKALHYRFK